MTTYLLIISHFPAKKNLSSDCFSLIKSLHIFIVDLLLNYFQNFFDHCICSMFNFGHFISHLIRVMLFFCYQLIYFCLYKNCIKVIFILLSLYFRWLYLIFIVMDNFIMWLVIFYSLAFMSFSLTLVLFEVLEWFIRPGIWSYC